MNVRRGRRITRATAEMLLDGRAGRPRAVALVLRAATAAPAAHEIEPAEELLTAIRGIRAPTRGRHRSKAPGSGTRRVAIAAGLALATTSSVALAASTGNLPGPLGDAAHRVFGLSGGAGKQVGAPAGDASDETGEASRAAESAPAPTDVPRPSLPGLCTAYRAGAGAHQPKVLDGPAFHVLIVAAGGKAEVADFCTRLIGPAPTHPAAPGHGRPATTPPERSEPSHPTGAPADRDSGRGHAPGVTNGG
jgi:hypothetical protein